MAFSINDLTQYFDNPALSKFSRKTKKGFTAQMGKMYPVNWEFLNFGNSLKGTSFHSLRLAPMLAPNFSDLMVQEHSCAVPLRVIMQNYEETFNYATNKDGAILPHFSATKYHDILRTMCLNGINPVGSLLDFLGYPVYADLFDCLDSIEYIIDDGPDSLTSMHTLGYYHFNHVNSASVIVRIYYRGIAITADNSFFSDYVPMDLTTFVANQKYPTFSNGGASPNLFRSVERLYTDLTHSYIGTVQDMDTYVPSIHELVEASSFDTVVSMMNAYYTYLFGFMLGLYLDQNVIPEDAPNYTTLPLRAYWRFHIDWNTNGNFVDRDAMLQDYVFNFEDTLNRGIGTASLLVKSTYQRFLLPVERLWRDDFFTSQLPTSAVDNAIEIPANSTVLDLAKLTAFQKLVLKLSYSSRYRDVVWNLFKITPSDARLQQSSVISRRYHNVGIGETIQTSESTNSSVLGNFAGRGYSSGQNDSYHILAEEPMIVINLFSLIPLASYADALHPNIHMDDIFDIPIPDMDVLGNQPIYSDLLSGNVLDSTEIFGYGRQYQEFLSNYDTVHGSFKTTLHYWQLTRRFGSTPRLNDQFLRMSSRDDFDQIFSVPESDHAMVSVVYRNSVTRHVHRNVRILV